jgi:hypothetical protein
MAFGDTIEDILLYRKFYTGEHLAAPERVLGSTRFAWQAYDNAVRERQSTPHSAHDQCWARQYEVGLAWVYQLGDKFRVTLYAPVNGRLATLQVDPVVRATLSLRDAFAATFTLGLGTLNG